MTRLSAFARTRTAPQLPLWLLFPLVFAAVDLSHWTLLRLPYFWDEAGYYIPATLDLFHTGTLIPHSTLTNAHPPLPSILLAAWWRFAGLAIVNTRTFVALVAAAALLGVFRLARTLTTEPLAAAVTLLTAVYPIWFAQSTLAHADIFAAAFTLWALSFYLEPQQSTTTTDNAAPDLGCHSAAKRRNLLFDRRQALTGLLFALAALSKETAIVTPLALATYEATKSLRSKRSHRVTLSWRQSWAIALILPILPLLAWYAFHFHQTGYIFGNPEFLRYNATATLDPHRIALALYHRLLHLTAHMDMFVPVACTLATLLIPAKKPGIPRPAVTAIAVVLLANWIEFSLLGGALLTRYLLPMYPLVLLLCLNEWHRRLPTWQTAGLTVLTAAAFVSAIFINPPYAFAPEDNLTYRDMIVLHQRAIAVLAQRFPAATVLSAWPVTAELARPELGYTRTPFKIAEIQNFSLTELQKAAADPGAFDTVLLFSTKWEPPPGRLNLASGSPAISSNDARFFDFHHDLRPAEAAALLHAEIVWQATQGGEWAAVLHLPRIVNARLTAP